MMSARIPSRRLLQSGASQCLPTTSITMPIRTKRTLFDFLRGRKDTAAPAGTSNPVLEEYLKRKPRASGPALVRGDLAPTSIFEGDRQIQERDEEKQQIASSEKGVLVAGKLRNPYTMAPVLDPKPVTRERWQRKMVIREIRKGGRLSKPQFVKRTERESVSKSHNMKTSVKKLGMVARQIAGKTVDDAIVQLRFSKKKVAKEVLEYLEVARDEAVVSRGMGLGGVTPAAAADAASASASASTPKPLEIQLKDGKRHTVTDKSKIYIDQAWVGRGPYGKAAEFRARGRTNILYTPWTSISLVLKEEATRVRLYEEREAKRKRQRETKVWTPLPDRPIQGQRQWFSW